MTTTDAAKSNSMTTATTRKTNKQSTFSTPMRKEEEELEKHKEIGIELTSQVEKLKVDHD